MADISKLSRLVSGAQKQVDLQQNTLVVGSLKVGATSPAELTKAILENLILLQNGGTGGAALIGVAGTPTNYTPTAATVQGHLEGIDTALATAAAVEFSDATFRIKDNVDATKKIAFQASGVATATTRTITMPDADVDLGNLTNSNISASAAIAYSKLNLASSIVNADISASAAIAYSKLDLASSIVNADVSASAAIAYSKLSLASSIVNADIASGAAIAESKLALDYSTSSLNTAIGTKVSKSGDTMTGMLTLFADPTAAMHAATKQYVDNTVLGVKPKQAVRVATTAPGTLASSFENGDTVDGVTLATGNRILIKDQSTSSENGIYIVQASGAPVRATDFDQTSPIDEINGSWVGVQEGTANGGKVFIQYGTVTTVGTDPILFTYFSDLSNLSGHDMITISGGQVSVDLATTSGLESSNPGNATGQLRIKLEASNPTLQINGSNELGAKLDAAGAVVTGASGLAVATDGSTIEKNANAIRVKADGINGTHIRLANDQYLRARDAADSADVNIFKVRASDDEAEMGTYLNVPAPAADTHAATKLYVDTAIKSPLKKPVKAASTGNLTLSGAQTVDGVSLVANDRILVKDQTTASNNGIYVVAAGAWTRATDSLGPESADGVMVAVQRGTVNGDTLFMQVTDGATFSSSQVWTPVPATGSSKTPVKAATTANIAILSGTMTVDGVSLSAGDRILVKDQFTPSQNGIYVVATGSWSRAADATVGSADGVTVMVQQGTANADIVFMQTTNGATWGSSQSWSLSSISSASGHDMISMSGNKFSVDLATAGGLESSNPGNAAGQLRIKAGSGVETTGSGLRTTSAPKLAAALDTGYVAGEAFAADTSFVVRYAVSGETAGAMYKADKDASVSDKFHAIGLLVGTGQVATDPVEVTFHGPHALGASDPSFAGTDIGKPVYLTASGAFSLTAPSATNEAVVRIGFLADTSTIFVQPQEIGIN